METASSLERRRSRMWWGRLSLAFVTLTGIVIYLPAQDRRPVEPPPAADDGLADADQPEKPPVLIRKIYDVGDLLFSVPDFPGPDSTASAREAEPGAAGGGGLFGPQGGDYTHDEAVEALVMLIQRSVEPDTWREAGGVTGEIVSVGNLLVVVQSAQGHAAVDALLTELRRRLKVLRVRAHWILTDRATIDALTAAKASDPAAALLTTTPQAIEKAPGIIAHLRGEIVCMDGQRTSVATFRAESAITDLEPSVGKNVAAYDPVITMISRGAVTDFRTKLSGDAKSAMMTVRTRVADGSVRPAGTRLPQIATARAGSTEGSGSATRPVSAVLQPVTAVDQTSEENHGFYTALRVPIGKMVLVGGMGLDAAQLLQAAAPADQGRPVDPPQLYLFVEVSSEKEAGAAAAPADAAP